MSESESGNTIMAVESTVESYPHSSESAMPGKSWRNSRWLAVVEFVLVALIFYADYRKLIPISKTPELLLLGWISLRVRGLRWRDVGLRRYRSWRVTIGLGIALGAVLETFQLLVTQPILAKLVGRQPDLELFRMLTGNIKMTLLFTALAWTLAALARRCSGAAT